MEKGKETKKQVRAPKKLEEAGRKKSIDSAEKKQKNQQSKGASSKTSQVGAAYSARESRRSFDDKEVGAAKGKRKKAGKKGESLNFWQKVGRFFKNLVKPKQKDKNKSGNKRKNAASSSTGTEKKYGGASKKNQSSRKGRSGSSF